VSKRILWLLGALVSAAVGVALTCGEPTIDTDYNVYGCTTRAVAHQGKPEPVAYSGSVPVNGFMEGYWSASETCPDGHRFRFARWMGKKPATATEWAIFYGPPNATGTLLPGEWWARGEWHPFQDTCEQHSFPNAGVYEFQTYTRASMYKGESPPASTAHDIVQCTYNP